MQHYTAPIRPYTQYCRVAARHNITIVLSLDLIDVRPSNHLSSLCTSSLRRCGAVRQEPSNHPRSCSIHAQTHRDCGSVAALVAHPGACCDSSDVLAQLIDVLFLPLPGHRATTPPPPSPPSCQPPSRNPISPTFVSPCLSPHPHLPHPNLSHAHGDPSTIGGIRA
ncbi:hypothetical protein FA95DRAFT_1229968 [Auriscalpium vulgare]|uniref:Uncharacterized protein n=1 Tax=Auriscalpium vulgare TaxID=40419 RepID=A0ACB8RTY7_9AGAM|nr:hypothetical protein FA95DRAFT_1229968 [Auriscalpium vulgare]